MLNVIYPPFAEPEARNSAVGWHWNTHTLSLAISQLQTLTVAKGCDPDLFGGNMMNLLTTL